MFLMETFFKKQIKYNLTILYIMSENNHSSHKKLRIRNEAKFDRKDFIEQFKKNNSSKNLTDDNKEGSFRGSNELTLTFVDVEESTINVNDEYINIRFLKLNDSSDGNPITRQDIIDSVNQSGSWDKWEHTRNIYIQNLDPRNNPLDMTQFNLSEGNYIIAAGIDFYGDDDDYLSDYFTYDNYVNSFISVTENTSRTIKMYNYKTGGPLILGHNELNLEYQTGDVTPMNMNVNDEYINIRFYKLNDGITRQNIIEINENAESDNERWNIDDLRNAQWEDVAGVNLTQFNL
jgi:hypothetical protein